jgi:ethanolamine utilization protein EutA
VAREPGPDPSSHAEHGHAHGHSHAHGTEQAHAHDHGAAPAHDHPHPHEHSHGQAHDHPHPHDHGPAHGHPHPHPHAEAHADEHEHDHAHDHPHPHPHDHGHDHPHVHPRAAVGLINPPLVPHSHGLDPGDEHDHVPGQEHVHLGEDALALWSVGIDVGSSTTHLTVSQLIIGHPNNVVHHKPEVLDRHLVYRSPIRFTPFVDATTIDAAAIEAFVAEGYAAVGITPDQIDTGAVICTGLAALKHNAAAVTERLAAESGRFVCATAGHHFEALLAARGSGSVDNSRRLDGIVANLDVGGGTTKLTLARDGEVLDTAAVAIGARLIVTDDERRVVTIEPGVRPLLAVAGVTLAEGDVLSPAAEARIAGVMAICLCGFLGLAPLDPLTARLLVTEAPHHAAPPAWLVVSGGVSEYVYGWQGQRRGDLGLALGRALRRALLARLPEERVLEPAEGIRATVIGACQYSVQVSGDTVYLSDPTLLPVHSVPVVLVPLEWERLQASAVEQAVTRALARADVDGACALAFRGPPLFGYGIVDALARGIAAALQSRPAGVPVVLAFDQDLANTVGRTVAKLVDGRVPLLCVDELQLGELDYLDLGTPPPGERYVPVVVKSLVFSG